MFKKDPGDIKFRGSLVSSSDMSRKDRPFSTSLGCLGCPLPIPPLKDFLPEFLSLPGSEDGMALEEKWVNDSSPLFPKLLPALTNAVTVKLLLWPGASRGRRAINPRWRPL